MEIPSWLEKLLEQNRALRSAVDSAIEVFGPWLDHSGQPFFPEYTIHNSEHVEYVLQTADMLIHDEARAIMTPADAAVLILSTILHDSAMHLSEDGFIAMIKNEESDYAQEYGDKPWKALWEEFIGEARRFDGHKLKLLFGDTAPVKVPKLDPQAMTKKDRMLIGEFLRRHHARLAHEIALYGVPGPTDEKLAIKNTDLYLRDIAGLVARSHGEEIRSCKDYLKKKYDLREYKGIHAVFLMALLRVADYLHITAERAPEQILQVKSLRSPISQGEWNAHHAINDIRHTHEDPESLYIDASPTEVKTFLNVKRWLTDIQKELDMSWAVLGEVYGRYQLLNNLGLTIRRVRSNLDDVGSFSATVDYIPYRAAFEAADADILKLLIEPLYNDNASIGARELIQNAVDAVRELWFFQELNPEYQNVKLFDQGTDVVVTTKKRGDEYYFEISDKGVGMTVNAVRNYFLKAGASFRKSDAWKKTFENEDGSSRVLRSGRFGIGVLAAFLIGDEIYVSTRHVTEDEGIEFTAELESDTIELKKIERSIGTLISIKISKKIIREFRSWHGRTLSSSIAKDWYLLSSPSFSLDGEQLSKYSIIPGDGQDLPVGWHRIEYIDYSDIHWSYKAAPLLSCNGIKIKEGHYNTSTLLYLDNLVRIKRPNVSVFDPDGLLPLNLTRTTIRGTYPFENKLKEDVLKDIAAYMVYSAPQKHVMKTTKLKLDYPQYDGFDKSALRNIHQSFYVYTCDGVSALSKWTLRELGISTLWVIPCGNGYDIRKQYESSFENVLLYKIEKQSALRDMYYLLFGIEYYNRKLIKGAHVLIPDVTAEYLKQPRRLRQGIRDGIRTLWQRNGWTLWSYGCTDQPDHMFEDIASKWDSSQVNYKYLGTAKLYLTTKDKSVFMDNHREHVLRIWRDIIGSPIIPYNLEKRKEVLADAYSRLNEYINAHVELVKRKTNRERS